MLKKFAILGLALLVAGTAWVGWIRDGKRREEQEAAVYRSKYGSELEEYIERYNEWLRLPAEKRGQLLKGEEMQEQARAEAKLQKQQRERLKADIHKLAAGEKDVYPFADIFYGENWQEELVKYKSQEEMKEFILTSSIVCVSAGVMIFGWCSLLWIARLMIRGMSDLRRFITGVLRRRREGKKARVAGVDGGAGEEGLQDVQVPCEEAHQSAIHSAVLKGSGWHNFDMGSVVKMIRFARYLEGDFHVDVSTWEAQKIAGLAPDERADAAELPEGIAAEQMPEFCDGGYCGVDVEQCDGVQTIDLAGSEEDSQKIEQTEGEEGQTEEFQQVAQAVKQDELEHPEPISNTLAELTEQMSAIREYATQQQERVERLQDGYDWNIVKTFCLRVILCIYNLEERMNRLAEEGAETTGLEEIRDELVFVLESSGVERFEPEINSDYWGQERCAEAIREREYSDEPNREGKIAKIVRAGYQYVIDDDNVKVVRPAQVKLFG